MFEQLGFATYEEIALGKAILTFCCQEAKEKSSVFYENALLSAREMLKHASVLTLESIAAALDGSA